MKYLLLVWMLGANHPTQMGENLTLSDCEDMATEQIEVFNNDAAVCRPMDQNPAE